MIQDPHPNTFGHSFSVEDDPNIEAALNVAIGSYTAVGVSNQSICLFTLPCYRFTATR